MSTLISSWQFRKERGQIAEDVSLYDFAMSDSWSVANNRGSINTLFDHLATFFQCREAKNFLLLPFEDFVKDRVKWLPIIANFMEIPYDAALIEKVAYLTSRESMLNDVAKFDESWVGKQREVFL